MTDNIFIRCWLRLFACEPLSPDPRVVVLILGSLDYHYIFGTAYAIVFEEGGCEAYAENAVIHLRRAVHAASSGDSRLWKYLNRLATALFSLYVLFSAVGREALPSDIEEAIACGKRALHLIPDTDPELQDDVLCNRETVALSVRSLTSAICDNQ
jgi:hypothetical protein